MIPSGAVFFILITAVLLAAALAWVLAALYQRRMLALMSSGTAPEPAAGVTESTIPLDARAGTWATGVDFMANRHATIRLMLSLGAISLFIALTQSWLALLFVYDDSEFSLNRLLVLGAIYAWPMVLAWGLARRWSWLRILGGIALYLLAMLVLVMIRSTEAQTLSSVSGWLFSQVAIPMTITLLIGASARIRAVAPYLLPPTLLLTFSSVLTLQALTQSVNNPAPWVIHLVETLGAYPTLLLFAFGPWLVMAWPVFKLGKWLAGAYRAKLFSDLSYLIGIYWFLILFASALPGMESVGWVAFVQVLAWLWLPVLLYGLRGPLTPPPGPPTLLVLRVFQRDAQVERLFDQVIERWRLTGNTVLIAGTDLLTRTLDADDLFVYLNGALAERFIASPAQVTERIEGFDWLADPDGRYRINECYCFDSTWQTALRALVARADLVLMDLRGFRAENKGCRHELGVLAGAAHLRRVIVLHDRETARDVAESEINPVASARFQWLPADRLDGAMAARVLAALFDKAM
ncbi:MAG: hypothetical protein JNM42_06250 [Propionivibrio sp.]|uniref:hypothetical protein n=1 Tax=Propionivibrio sp. TaxID=2212460 RepID=UPI001A545105|nr:hypothetical protein [Propionivibrio sp.]MBL8414018.1 hypothetical protein [Propionivibrio sp.]